MSFFACIIFENNIDKIDNNILLILVSLTHIRSYVIMVHNLLDSQQGQMRAKQLPI